MKEIYYTAWMGETACYFDENYNLYPDEGDDERDKFFLQKDVLSFKGSGLEYPVTDELILYVEWMPCRPDNHELIIAAFLKQLTIKGNYYD